MAVWRRLQERSCQPAATRMWCLSAIVSVDGWEATVLNGVASAAYTAADWSNVTATVSADSVRGWEMAGFSELRDVTADGSAVWTRVGSGSSTQNHDLHPGRRLTSGQQLDEQRGHIWWRFVLGNPSQRQERNSDSTISRSPLTAPSTHLTGASTRYGLADRSFTPARFESSITERWWRVFTATAATI